MRPCEFHGDALLVEPLPERMIFVVKHLCFTDKKLKTTFQAVGLSREFIPRGRFFRTGAVNSEDVLKNSGGSGSVRYAGNVWH